MENFEIKNNEPQTHLFKTDSLSMANLGLSVFTTGVLYEYFNQRDKAGRLENRKKPSFIRTPGARDVQNIETFLGYDGKWEGFRKTEFTGFYAEQDWNTWQMEEVSQIKPYSIADVPLQIFAPDDLGPVAGAVLDDDGNLKIKRKAWYPLKSVGSNYNSTRNHLENVEWINQQKAMLAIIGMNDFMIEAKTLVPRSEWKSLGGTINKDNIFAINAYLEDIKSSKTGSITGSGLVEFYYDMAGGLFKCPKQSWVSWELMLRDKPLRNTQTKQVVISNQLVSDFKRDESGREYVKNVDGEMVSPDQNSKSDKTVAKMDLNYNAYKDKWQSGTTSLLAAAAEDIPAAPYPLPIDILLEGDVQGIINNTTENEKVTFGSGLVMPIYMQNGNPYQWAPNYSSTQTCRADDKTKQRLLAFNFNPNKSYEKGNTVVISEIGGVWHVMDPGFGTVEEQPRRFDAQWQFQQIMMSRNAFFRGTETGTNRNTLVSPSVAERYHHLLYYKFDTKNGGGVGREYNDQFSSLGLTSWKIAPSGKLQITSFDFMDSQIFGTRGIQNNGVPDKNALNTTLATVDAAGRTIPLGNADRNAAHSGPFFGCAFPDGYLVDNQYFKINAQNPLDHRIVYHNSGAVEGLLAEGPARIPKGGEGHWTENTVNMGELFFNTQGSDPTVNPFYDEEVPAPPDPPGEDSSKYRHRVGIRSDPRSAVNSPASGLFGAKETWERFSAYQGPSMFQLFTNGSDRNLRQLPADIALNAHIDSPNGGPLYDAHRTDNFYIHAEEVNNAYRFVDKAAFAKAAWLRKYDGEGKTDPAELAYSSSDSAFGFKPNNPYFLQFRPLKMETYAMFNGELRNPSNVARYYAPRIVDYYGGIKDVPDALKGSAEKLFIADRYELNWPNALKDHYESKGVFGTAGHFMQRASWSCVMARQNLSLHNPVDIDWVLKRARLQGSTLYSDYIDVLPFFDNDIPTGFHGPNNGPRSHRRSYWWTTALNPDVSWQSKFMNANEFGSAIGVIGAVSTVSAGAEIVFNTYNYFGMRSQSLFRFFFGFNLRKEIASWGGSDNGYDAYNTTCLAVTVYHAHPRAQTVYDPGYFAVHHYNPRPEYADLYIGDNPDDYYSSYEEPTPAGGFAYHWPDEHMKTYEDGGVKIRYATDFTGVGLREPSIAPASDGPPARLSPNSLIFRGGYYSGGGVTTLLPDAYSWLNVTRVGKLLPYRYKTYQIVLPAMTVDEEDKFFVSAAGANSEVITSASLDEDGIEAATLQSQGVKLIVVNFGQGYKIGDIVGDSSEGGVRFRVASVDPFNGQSIVGLQLIEGRTPQETIMTTRGFANHDAELNPNSLSSAYTNLSTISSFEGTGFDAYFFWGEVQEVYKIDQKPRYVSRDKQISANADNTPDLEGDSATPFGFVAVSLDSTVTVSDDPSPDQAYDCFYHFHNDTMFNWLSNTAGFYGDPKQGNSITDEQYIELRISPN